MQIGNKKPALSTKISRTPLQRMQKKINKMYFKVLSKINKYTKVLVQIIGCLSLLFCFSCQNQAIDIDKVISALPMSIDNGTNFGLEDDESGYFELEPDDSDFYPYYHYYNKKLAAYIFILFVGKTEQEKMYWNVDNPSGYFIQRKGANQPDLLSNEIKKHLQERGLDNYDITAIVIYEKDIEKISSIDESEVKSVASAYSYHFKNNHWIFDKAEKIDTDFIKEVLK